jgi:hypothetical protein
MTTATHPTPETLQLWICNLERALSSMRLRRLLASLQAIEPQPQALQRAIAGCSQLVNAPAGGYCHRLASEALDDAEALLMRAKHPPG